MARIYFILCVVLGLSACSGASAVPEREVFDHAVERIAVLREVLGDAETQRRLKDASMSPSHIRSVLVEAMGTTCSNWKPIDSAMEDIVGHGDAAVEDLVSIAGGEPVEWPELAGQENWMPLDSDRCPKDFQRARAMILLQRIGTKRAKGHLRDLASADLGDPALHRMAMCAWCKAEGEDVVHGDIDRAWYDMKVSKEWLEGWMKRKTGEEDSAEKSPSGK